MSNTASKSTLWIIAIFIAGLCSIIYELLISTVSSYFLGDSVRQFSITIGLYMASMGLGSYFSRSFKDPLVLTFVSLELCLGILGGISVPVLYFTFAWIESAYVPMMVFLIMSIGTLIGMEIPFLSRLMEPHYNLRLNISTVLSVDYVGALLATMVFPFLLLPFIGVYCSSLCFGLVNMGIGIVSLMGSKDELEPQVYRSYMGKVFLCIAFLLGLLITTPWFLQHYENSIYNDRIILSERSRFQKIVFTRNKSDIRLFLDGNLQFSSLDEYRYHESLIHTAMLATSNHHKILMLGGGDGLGLKEVLKYDSVGEVHLVDIDRQLVDICRQREFMTELNHNSLNSKKVQLIHTDAMGYLQDSAHLYNVIIADLPDPNHTSLARLYSVEFYRLIEKHLAADGVFSTQATSPFYARQSFSCIIKTLGASPFKTVLPFETYIPSFGQWGFALAYKHKGQLEFSDLTKFKLNTKYLDSTQFKKIGHLDKDVSPLEVKVNHMDRPIILEYYQNDWQHWN